MLSDNRQIGTGLLALGGIFLFLGVILFFDPGLLAMGEIRFPFAPAMLAQAGHSGVSCLLRNKKRLGLCDIQTAICDIPTNELC